MYKVLYDKLSLVYGILCLLAKKVGRLDLVVHCS